VALCYAEKKDSDMGTLYLHWFYILAQKTETRGMSAYGYGE